MGYGCVRDAWSRVVVHVRYYRVARTMKLVNDHGFLQADLGRCESASLRGGRPFANLGIGLE